MARASDPAARVFISYAREDAMSAKRLYGDLRSAGVDAWLDSEMLLPGQRWQREIETAIRGSKFFVALLSTNSIQKRGYVQKELKHALSVLDEMPESTLFMIPARLDDCNPPDGTLRELQWVDMYPSWDDGLSKILRVVDFAAQARQPASVVVASSVPSPISLLGTVWSGVDSDKDHYRFEFLADGELQYTKASGTFTNAHWEQDGVSVYFQMNNGYAQYRGTLDGAEMSGVAQNIMGRSWRWSVKREV